MYQTFLKRVRRHPVLTFGAAGGGFALLFVLLEPIRSVLSGQGLPLPSGSLWLLVVGGFLGGSLLAWLLWERLGGEWSPIRGTAVGALVGLLALPVPFYVLEIALVVLGENVFEPLPGASPVVQLLSDSLLFLLTPLLLGALGLIPTYGGTVVVGALVGYLLAHD
ncbi:MULTISPECIES: hypothetical protein [unclassified Halobacterium]|jgi:hypothetical protein|uniref:hypothetical protein n=1 Tax=unclassified Halobacterium TaxID=2668073 RepID=UPI001E587B38|nr:MULTISPECIES: hypothetical protein [unclassified Halobacterium]MCD2200613.1 hypothetical protein [Halobacterium sp. KA-4]MCD2203096.1 hypothetical protein [Halobacterium sp. KA-6]